MGDEGPAEQIHWNAQLEQIISEEGERAICFFWLHNKSEMRYRQLSHYISLPVTVLSYVSGSFSIGSQIIFPNETASNITVGMVSLLCGVLNTVSNYFSWAKRSEGHRIAAINYMKMYRFISIELALPPGERMAARDMLKHVREQLDRQQETSPPVPMQAINMFNLAFDTTTDVKKPEITNGIDPISVYRGGGMSMTRSQYVASPRRFSIPSSSSQPPRILFPPSAMKRVAAATFASTKPDPTPTPSPSPTVSPPTSPRHTPALSIVIPDREKIGV